jgi:ketosteroid isomerase-like protein
MTAPSSVQDREARVGSSDQLFADIDSMDPDAFARHLAEDVVMRFGNAPPIHGREAVREAWASFCADVDGVSHSLAGHWELDDATIAEAEVTYTRKAGDKVTVPVVTIYRPGGGQPIADYRIFIDLAPLFA